MKKTFASIPEKYGEYKNSRVVLMPVLYDGTSTWIKGSDKGPQAFLKAAENMEMYDIPTDSEPYKMGIFLADEMKGFSTPEKMVEKVKQEVDMYLKDQKLVTMIGGEHSITIGAVKAVRENFDNCTILQIDAHSDLRPEYEATPFNHACAMYEASQTGPILQVGIRSMDSVELPHMDKERIWFAHDIQSNNRWISEVVDKCTSRVYITIDLDAFDSSIMPATGTPEPGGLTWYQVQDLLMEIIKNKKVIGFDIVELCPLPGNRAPDFLAAKLYYRLLAEYFRNS